MTQTQHILQALQQGRHLPPEDGEPVPGTYWHRRFIASQAQLKVAQEELCHLQAKEPTKT
jgi:hypothetical protein